MIEVLSDGKARVHSCENFDHCESAGFCGMARTRCARKLLAVVSDGTIPAEEKLGEMADAVRIGLIPERSRR